MRAPRLIARAFADARDGNIAIMFALVALPMFSMVGIAVDYSRAIKAQRQMQLAADAAVLAAASLEGASSAERQDRAEAIFASNVASNPNTAGSQASALAQGDTVTVTAQVSVPTTFMGVVGLEALPVNVSATALAAQGSVTSGGTVCVLALNPNASSAFSINGTTDYRAIDCATYSNSRDSWSLRGVGTSSAIATAFFSSGGVSGADQFTPVPLTGQPVLADPLAGLPQPYSSACGSKDKGTKLNKGNHTLTAGTYCGGLWLGSGANVTFGPGIYVIKGGALEMTSGSSSYGRDVHFHFVGDGAHLKVRGGADADLQAMTWGTYGGILFAQDPFASPGDVSDVQGGGTMKLVGALYFPTQEVDVGGNGNLGLETDAWAIIADTIRVHGNGQVRLKANFAALGMPDILPKVSPKSPRLTN